MEITSSNRRAKVTDTTKYKIFPTDPLSKPFFVNDYSDKKELWLITISFKSGSLPERATFWIAETEEEADTLLSRFHIGSLYDIPYADGIHVCSRDGKICLSEDNDASQTEIFDNPNKGAAVFSVPDDDNFLAWRVLKDAGFTDGINLSVEIKSFLGEARIKKLTDIFGENWSAVALMEYCWYNLDNSSIAYIAAQRRYNDFILQDEYAAGYLQRDLEILVEGVEDALEKARDFRERQSKRSAKGGAATSLKAKERRSRFDVIALGRAADWIWKSEKEQRRFLKNLAVLSDEENGEDLFTRNNKILSDAWFDNAIAELRQSGALRTAMTRKKP